MGRPLLTSGTGSALSLERGFRGCWPRCCPKPRAASHCRRASWAALGLGWGRGAREGRMLSTCLCQGRSARPRLAHGHSAAGEGDPPGHLGFLVSALFCTGLQPPSGQLAAPRARTWRGSPSGAHGPPHQGRSPRHNTAPQPGSVAACSTSVLEAEAQAQDPSRGLLPCPLLAGRRPLACLMWPSLCMCFRTPVTGPGTLTVHRNCPSRPVSAVLLRGPGSWGVDM